MSPTSLLVALAALTPFATASLSWPSTRAQLRNDLTQESERPFQARMADYEGRRMALEQAFDVATSPFSSGAATALLAAVKADSDVPEWYAGEIRALAESFLLVEGLGDDGRDETLAALRVRPDPASNPEGIIADFEGAIEELSGTLGPHHPVISQRYFFLSNITGQMGRWDDSVRYAEAAVEAAEGLEGERGAQTALRRMWLGWIYRTLSRNEEAEAALVQARETLDRLGTSGLGVWLAPRAHVDNYLGTLYTDLGRFDEAEPVLTDYVARAEFIFGPTSTAHLGGLNNLARLLGSMRLHDRAVTVQARCLRYAEAGLPADSLFLAQVLLNLGIEEQRAGLLQKSKHHLERATQIIDPQHLRRELAVHARLQLARLAILEGDYTKAVQWTDEAMADTEAVASVVPEERALIKQLLLWTMIRVELWDRAEGYLEAFEEPGKDMYPERTEFFRLLLDARAPGAQEIRERFESVIKALDAKEPDGSSWCSAARSKYASYLREQGSLEEARGQLLEATEIYEQSRAQLKEGFGRSAFHISPQPSLALVNLELGRDEDALRTLEDWRGRSLHELIRVAGDELRTGLRDKLRSMDEALMALEPGPGGTKDTSPAAKMLRAKYLQKRATVREQLAAAGTTIYSEPSSLEELRGLLGPGEAYFGWTLIDYFGDKSLVAWTLGQAGAPRLAKIGDGEAIVGRLHAFAEALGAEAKSVFEPDPSAVHAEARALGDILFGLAKEADPSLRHLLLVPGELDGMPFEALRPKGVWAGERWTMAYAPSATLHALLRGRTPRPAFLGSILSVGDPLLLKSARADDDEEAPTRSASRFADLRPVPASGVEAKAIAAMYPKSLVLTGKDAREELLMDVGAEHSVIHIASHALVGGSDLESTGIVLSQVNLPRFSGLALQGKRPIDGFLSVPEIASDWKIDADLVTLSSCRSALGPEVRGEGYVGLSSALFQAGAGAVLASLWEVQDEPTRLFMEAFYREWRALTKEGPSPRAKAMALREARRYLRDFEADGRRPYAHPAFWSAFVLIGNPD